MGNTIRKNIWSDLTIGELLSKIIKAIDPPTEEEDGDPWVDDTLCSIEMDCFKGKVYLVVYGDPPLKIELT